ncbi:hypothetical protein ADUPG1_012388 [Aduncisulcus paluster]|uniref:Uncharacterized protein n=1 Tax=Aduncisulcus paluster TaxID=2918883 RepID=A0ABQ5K312_9EUKA|nr:hypothetical protein ADUPG1_012388 [Aduncisulcus paluster]
MNPIVRFVLFSALVLICVQCQKIPFVTPIFLKSSNESALSCFPKEDFQHMTDIFECLIHDTDLSDIKIIQINKLDKDTYGQLSIGFDSQIWQYNSSVISIQQPESMMQRLSFGINSPSIQYQSISSPQEIESILAANDNESDITTIVVGAGGVRNDLIKGERKVTISFISDADNDDTHTYMNGPVLQQTIIAVMTVLFAVPMTIWMMKMKGSSIDKNYPYLGNSKNE